MTRAQIQSCFPALSANFGGLLFAAPSLEWMRGEFYAYFRAELWDDNLDKWQVKWTCRDFVRAYASAAQKCFAKSQAAPVGYDSVAVGEVWFIPERNPATNNREGHAVNVIFTGTSQFTFLDPQTNQVWPMTSSEINSIYYLRF